MKKIVTLLALGSVSLLSAYDYNDNAYDNGNNGYRGNRGYNNQSSYRYGYDQPSNAQNYNQSYGQAQNYNEGQQYYQPNNNPNYYQDRQNYAQSNGQKPVSDKDLADKIHDKLSPGLFSKGHDQVTYEIYNGVVTLRGSVNTLKDKQEVEQTIKEIDGVRNVNNQIAVAANPTNKENSKAVSKTENKYPQDSASTATDKQINAKIRDKVNGGWFSKENETLIFKTANGYVTIIGVVEKPEDAKKINDQVQDVEGVRGINNQLQVKNENK